MIIFKFSLKQKPKINSINSIYKRLEGVRREVTPHPWMSGQHVSKWVGLGPSPLRMGWEKGITGSLHLFTNYPNSNTSRTAARIKSNIRRLYSMLCTSVVCKIKTMLKMQSPNTSSVCSIRGLDVLGGPLEPWIRPCWRTSDDSKLIARPQADYLLFSNKLANEEQCDHYR